MKRVYPTPRSPIHLVSVTDKNGDELTTAPMMKETLGLGLNRSHYQRMAEDDADDMAVAAVRYCLGQTGYITSDCVDWLMQQWPHLKPSTCAAIQREIYDHSHIKRDRFDMALIFIAVGLSFLGGLLLGMAII